MKRLKTLFFSVLAFVALGGSVSNALRLLHSFYLWSLVRFVGYGSLLVYSLLMLWGSRYNNPSLTEETKG